MKLHDIISEVRSAIKEGRKAILWDDWDSAPGVQCTTKPDLWGMKAPIGGCGCIKKPRGRVVMCGVKQWDWEWKHGYSRVHAEFDPNELLKLMTTPCSHGHLIWKR